MPYNLKYRPINQNLILQFLIIYQLIGNLNYAYAERERNKSVCNLGEIVVSASRTEEPVEKIPASVTVITKEDIEKRGVVTIDEVLREVPGLHIARFGTIGEESFPRMRGADKSHLLVMIDGVTLNPAYDDIFDFADYHVDNVERIEIIRGSYSALYGSDAIAGIINIITKKPEKGAGYYAAAEAGSFHTFRELIGANGADNDLKYTLSASRTDSKGNYDRDTYKNHTFSSNFDYYFSPKTRLNFVSRFIDTKKELIIHTTANTIPPIRPRVVYDQNASTVRKTLVGSLSYIKEVSKIWDYRVTSSYFNFHNIENDETEPAVPLAFFQSNTNSRRYTLETQHNLHLSKMDTVNLGLVYEREEVYYNGNTNFTFNKPAHEEFNNHRTNYGSFIQNIFNWNDKWILILGARYDRYDGFGSVISPKISTSYLIEQTQTKLKSSYGYGYHAPSFEQLHSAPLGNPSLNPEKSKSFEIGFDQYFYNKLVCMGVVYFHIDYRDRIDKDLAGYQYINTQHADSEGYESYIEVMPIEELTLRANYTSTKARNNDTGKELSGIPEYMLNLGATYNPNDRISANLDINFVGSKAASSSNITGLDGIPLGNSNPPYVKVDLSASYIIARNYSSFKDITLYGSIQNLLNEKYSEVIGGPSPGINFLTGVKASF